MLSRQVVSNQHGIHERLLSVLRRRRQSCFQQQPLSGAAPEMELLFREISEFSGPLLLDSGCGNGEGARRLAERFPTALVIGVDKSAKRLRAAQRELENESHPRIRFIRSDLVQFWMRLRSDGVRVHRHYLFYPNPWPKRKHLYRRWHGHPIFPELIALSNFLVVRSNWRVYLEEFSMACQAVSGQPGVLQSIGKGEPVSAFERKYMNSNQQLWELSFEFHPLEHSNKGETQYVGYQN